MLLLSLLLHKGNVWGKEVVVVSYSMGWRQVAWLSKMVEDQSNLLVSPPHVYAVHGKYGWVLDCVESIHAGVDCLAFHCMLTSDQSGCLAHHSGVEVHLRHQCVDYACFAGPGHLCIMSNGNVEMFEVGVPNWTSQHKMMEWRCLQPLSSLYIMLDFFM